MVSAPGEEHAPAFSHAAAGGDQDGGDATRQRQRSRDGQNNTANTRNRPGGDFLGPRIGPEPIH
jgi:hypothetical protein